MIELYNFCFYSHNTALTAYLSLKWSTLIILHGIGKGPESDYSELPKLIEAQANLSAASLASGDSKLSRKVFSLLMNEWNAVSSIQEKYVENLSSLEASNGVIVLASLLMKYLVQSKQDELAEKLKVSLIIEKYHKTLFIAFFSSNTG